MKMLVFVLIGLVCIACNNGVNKMAECTQRQEWEAVNQYAKQAYSRRNKSDQAFIALLEHMAFKPGYEETMGTVQREQFLRRATEILNAPGVKVSELPVTLLVDAVRWRHYDIAELLLSLGMNLHCYAQTTTDNFLKVFSWPFNEGEKQQQQLDYRYQMLEKILKAGVNPNETNLSPVNNGLADYPINYAAKKCDLKAVGVLLRHGADANLKAAFENYPIYSACGFPLEFYHDAVSRADVPPLFEIIELLLKYGANPNILGSESILGEQETLAGICSGELSGTTPYDYYLARAAASEKTGNHKQRTALYHRVAALIAEKGGKSLERLCGVR